MVSSIGVFRTLVAIFASMFFLISILLPNHYLPWLAAYQEFSAFLMLLLILLLSVLEGNSIKVDGVSIVLVVFSFVPIFQYLSSVIFFWGDAWISFIYLMAFSLSIVVGYNLCSSASLSDVFVKYASLMLIFVSVVSVWISLRQWLMFPGNIWMADLKPGERPYANIGQANNFSTILFLGVLSIFYLYEKKVVSSFLGFVIVIVIVFGISLAQSRTSLAIYVLIFSFYLFFNFRNGCYVFRIGRVSVFLWFLFCLFLWFFVPSLSEFLMISESSLSSRITAYHRLDMYQQFLIAICDGPFWGYGWNQVTVAQSSVSLIYPVQIFTQYTHNVILDILIWNGPVLGFVFVALFGLFLLFSIFKIKSCLGFFSISFVFSVLVHAFFEYPHAYAYFLVPFGIVIGFLTNLSGVKSVFSISFRYVFCIFMIGIFIISHTWIEYRRAENSSRQMRFEMARIGSELGQDYSPNLMMLTQLDAFFRFSMLIPDPYISDEDLEFMRRVSLRYPYPSVLFRYGLSLSLIGNYDEAAYQFNLINVLHGGRHYSETIEYLYVLSETSPSIVKVISLLEHE